MRNQQNVKVRVNSSFETICPFPVGYVYMSSNSISPGSIYGGTWAGISGGRYMRAAGAWGNGGSNTISTSQMPSHNHIASASQNIHSHDINGNVLAWYGSGANGGYPAGSAIGSVGTYGGGRINTTQVGHTHSITIQSTGGGGILSYVPKRLGVVQNCLKKVMLRA